jgi:3-oxoacyl-[acyl-carrier-protein] synthase-1
MNRVVVTGVGVVSSIGNDVDSVLISLRESRSGLEHVPEMEELGLACQVGGTIKGFDPKRIPKRARQTMSPVSQYAAVAALDALEDAGIPIEEVQVENAGVVAGTSLGGIGEWGRAQRLLEEHRNPSRLGATGVVKGMHATVSGNLATFLGIQGRAYALCTSFSSGLDNIGHACELVARGVLDVCLCGAAEENALRQFWVYADNWGGMAAAWNDRPQSACRPYDRERGGTVLSEGAGILVLESEEHAAARGVSAYAEIVGYGSANDGDDMFEPSGEGLSECIRQGLQAAAGKGHDTIDYVNTHGTGTRVHDALEVRLLREIFGERVPPVSSTKGLAGHGLGATGAQEAVFTLLMLRNGFIAPTHNLEQIAEDCEGVPHVTSLTEAPLQTAMCFNAGLGGTNASLVFART